VDDLMHKMARMNQTEHDGAGYGATALRRYGATALRRYGATALRRCDLRTVDVGSKYHCRGV